MISLNIDGKYVKVPEGSTILDAAKALGIEIPRCATWICMR